ncbi:MAG: lysostaphin resistance A-like protein [bacterium]
MTNESEDPFSGGSFPPEEPDPEDEPDLADEGDFRNRFVTITLLFEACLALLGLAFGTWSGVAWKPLIVLNPDAIFVGLAGGVGLFLTHLLLLYPGGESNPLYRYIFKPFKESLLSRIPSLDVEDIIFISVLSGLGEEILFRGWLQMEFGIVLASVLFGLIHIWGKEGIGYGIYAIGMGFVLGYLFQYTGYNLWAPVTAHAVNNFLGLLAIEMKFTPGED